MDNVENKQGEDSFTNQKVSSNKIEGELTVSFEKVKSNVEAILFSYGDWISVNEIKDSLGLDSIMIINTTLNELVKKYDENFSFQVEQNENSKWRMALRDEFTSIVSDLISNVEIPPKVLKVLSVIAYEQPVTKTRLADILGRSVKSEVSHLYRNKFLSYEKQGIGKYYRVTKKFYDYFKLDEGEDFKQSADKSIKVFLEEPTEIVKNLEEEK